MDHMVAVSPPGLNAEEVDKRGKKPKKAQREESRFKGVLYISRHQLHRSMLPAGCNTSILMGKHH
jgi:hypothetical protein